MWSTERLVSRKQHGRLIAEQRLVEVAPDLAHRGGKPKQAAQREDARANAQPLGAGLETALVAHLPAGQLRYCHTL